jgi:hypothetical protein
LSHHHPFPGVVEARIVRGRNENHATFDGQNSATLGHTQEELSGIQLIRTFIERRIQPLSARAHCMWDYTDRQDSTRIFPDELKESEIDDSVRVVTKLKKKSIVPKVFGTTAFSKLNPRT